MSPFNGHTSHIGFSTGALERGNYRDAVRWMVGNNIHSMELSALRFDELEPLVSSLGDLPLDKFDYVSFHAPSSFSPDREEQVIDLLQPVYRRGWNIVVHPDVIYTPARWLRFGEQLLIENMDRRKPIGRTSTELTDLFSRLPKARLCLDVAHARQMDTTLTLLWDIIRRFADRVAEIHISELDSRCRHQPMSRGAVMDYKKVMARAGWLAPVIVESMLDRDRSELRQNELLLAKEAMSSG
ncbi:MAG: hypothetical protein ACKVY0_05325 [Prosthecobacter sp.]|uniref:hypothetical protein n=1 Tax=Prosthecobacter sp. TaxID=1965333 RepID=UPI0039036A08